jgi:hypothetical protein
MVNMIQGLIKYPLAKAPIIVPMLTALLSPFCHGAVIWWLSVPGYDPGTDSHQITAPWQNGLSNAVSIGTIIGAFANRTGKLGEKNEMKINAEMKTKDVSRTLR